MYEVGVRRMGSCNSPVWTVWSDPYSVDLREDARHGSHSRIRRSRLCPGPGDPRPRDRRSTRLPVEGALPAVAGGHASCARARRSSRPASARCATGSTAWPCSTASRSRRAASPTPTASCAREAWRAAEETGELRYSEFATDPCRSLFRRVDAMFSPGAQRQRLRQRLARGRRVHRHDRDSAARRLRPARPSRRPGSHIEPPGHAHARRTRTTTPSAASCSTSPRAWARARTTASTPSAPREEQRVIGSVGVRHPGYVHSFGMTERYLVLAEFPLVVDPLRLATSGRPYIENYRWEPERGARVPRDRARERRACAASTRPTPSSPSTTSTRSSAADELVVDLCAYDDASRHRRALSRPHARGRADPAGPAAALRHRAWTGAR